MNDLPVCTLSSLYDIPLTGVYQPRVRCYELAELSMKFERYFTSEGSTADTRITTVSISMHQLLYCGLSHFVANCH